MRIPWADYVGLLQIGSDSYFRTDAVQPLERADLSIPDDENARRMCLAHYLMGLRKECPWSWYKNLLVDNPAIDEAEAWIDVPILLAMEEDAVIFPLLLGRLPRPGVHIEEGRWLWEDARSAAKAVLNHAQDENNGFVLLKRAEPPSERIKGGSLALPLGLGARFLKSGKPYPGGLYATGAVGLQGEVSKVGYVDKKYKAAKQCEDFRIFFFPEENNGDVEKATQENDLFPVHSVDAAYALGELLELCPGKNEVSELLCRWRRQPDEFFAWLAGNYPKAEVVEAIAKLARIEHWYKSFKNNGARELALDNLIKWKNACNPAMPVYREILTLIVPKLTNSEALALKEEAGLPSGILAPNITNKGRPQAKGLRAEEIHEPKQVIIHNLNRYDVSIPATYVEDKTQTEEVFSMLSADNKKKIIFIYGEGGIGKSTLAKRIADLVVDRQKRPKRFRKEQYNFDVVIWLSAKDSTITEDDYYPIALDVDYEYLIEQMLATMNIERGERLEDNVEKLLSNLENRRMLLIIDNYETISDNKIRLFIEQRINSEHKVLITSRYAATFSMLNSCAYNVCGMTDQFLSIFINKILAGYHYDKNDVQIMINKESRNLKCIELSCALIQRDEITIKEFYKSQEYLAHWGDRFEYLYKNAISRLSRKALFLLKIFILVQFNLPLPLLKFIFNNKIGSELRELEGVSIIKRIDKAGTKFYFIEQIARTTLQLSLFSQKEKTSLTLSNWLANRILTYIGVASGDSDWSPPNILTLYGDLHEMAMQAVATILKGQPEPHISQYIVKAAHNASFTGFSMDCITRYLLPLKERLPKTETSAHILVLRQLMWDYFLIDEYDKSRKAINELLALARSRPEFDLLAADALRIRAMIYYHDNDLISAREYMERALQRLPGDSSSKAEQLKAAIYEAYANVEESFERKKEKFIHSVKIALKQEHNSPFVSLLYQKLVKTLIDENKLDRVLEYLDKSREHSVGRKRGIAYDSLYRALYYEKKGDIKKAYKYIEDARVRFEALNRLKRVNEDYERIVSRLNYFQLTRKLQ